MGWKRVMSATTRCVLLIALLSGLMVSSALAQPPERVQVLIGFTQLPGPAQEALVRAFGGSIKHTYHLVPAIAATLPETAMRGLRANPVVTVIEPDGQVWAVDAELDNTWGVKRIGAGAVHPDNTGAGVKVAIIDTGIDYTHPELDANYAGGYDFVNKDNDPMDDNRHGTHVAGTVAAVKNGAGVVGVAPEAHLYALKVLGADGSGSYSAVIAALQWAVDNGIQVTNNSYGSSTNPGTTVQQAFDNAYAAGVLNVCAAGNTGTSAGDGDNVIYPARYDSCIAVAATDKNDNRASFSSTGPAVELAAPGVSINSTVPGGYATLSGTSMASPHAAGTAALVIASGITDANGDGKINDEVRLRLQQTADDLGAAGRDPQYGFGLVDADEAAPAQPVEVYDVAATAIVASPSSVVKGDLVLVDIAVENRGTSAETFDVVLTDDTASATIGAQPVSLAAGASTTVGFSWDTTGATVGNLTLTATAGPVAGETDTSDNSKSVVVTVTEPSATTMHVGDLDGTKSLKGKSGRWEVFVTVTIHDEDHGPVSSATVTGEWTGAKSGTASAVTGSNGTVTFSTGNMNNGKSVTFTVTGVTHASLTYSADANHDPDGDSNGTSITIYK